VLDVAASISTTTDTHCAYYALQCGMTLSHDGAEWAVAARDFPTNKGGLCKKGWTAASLLTSPERLTTAMIRDPKGGQLRPASFEEALDRVALDIGRIQATHGRDAVGVFGGGGLTNEKAYLLGKFARVALGTANIDHNSRFCMGSGANGNLRAFGLDRGRPFPLADSPGAEAGVADHAGISFDRIEAEGGVFWPCPTTEHAGTPRLFRETFATLDRRANLHPVRFRGAAEQPDGEFPYILTTGRVLAHYQTGAQTRRVPALCAAEPDPFVEIHPDTACGLRIADGDTVRLTTRRGVAFVRARLSRDIRMDVLFAPFHWGGRATINWLTNPALDPISKIPEFKACAVRAERVEPADARSTAALQTERAEVA